MRVVILGSGPAGLAAVKAAYDADASSIILVSNRFSPSPIMGCQYLHAPIPGYETVRSTMVDYILVGTPGEYRQKVYGSDWEGKVSPEDFIGQHEAWDIRETYRRMWSDLRTTRASGSSDISFITMEIRYGQFEAIYDLNADVIISTIPAPALCQKGHLFRHHAIWAAGDRFPKAQSGIEDQVICDGTDGHSWYRTATVFGYSTTEWPGKPVTLTDAVRVIKPLATECTCLPDVFRTGRYGTWDKKTLVSDVYPAVAEYLKRL